MQGALQELKQQKIWLCWNYAVRNGTKTKVPCSVKGRVSGTNWKFAETWVTYEEAAQATQEHDFSGVGFVIPKGYFFLDIDHKTLRDETVQTCLRRFNTYAEYSVSGNGIHLYGKCELDRLPVETDDKGRIQLSRQFYMKNPHNDMELYIGGLTNRFAVYTDNVIEDKPLAECTSAVLMTLHQDMQRKPMQNQHAQHPSVLQGDQVIESLRSQKNGEKFARLFDHGEIDAYGQDDSAADCALCAMIAFRTGNDPDLIDAVFRQSALMRDKWERADYREMTIRAAIEACHGVFNRSVMPAPEFIQFDKQTGKATVSPPLLARHIRENLYYLFVRDTATGATLKFVYASGCYRLYSDDMFKGIIKSFIAAYDEMLVKMGQVNEVYQLLLTDLNTHKDRDLNADEDFINFQNGLLRLSDLRLLPHTPDVLSTVQLQCQWHGVPAATPTFDRYMHTLTNGCREDEQVIMEFMGGVFSNVKGWRMKKALFLDGPGDTGKSQAKSLAEKILGKGNYVGIDLSEIEARFGTGNIYNKRLAGSSDMSFVTVSELKTFKKCTGGDSLFAEFKGMNGFEFTYNGLLWFCMNRLPKFGGDDGDWVYNRILLIHCRNVIPPEKQDKHLLDKLYAEREGIVYKAVMAFRGVIQGGYRFSEPQSVVEARREYRNTNNTVILFFEECMTKRSDAKIHDGCTTGRVYKVYKAWCKDNNNGYAKTAREFREALAAHNGSTFGEMTVQRKQGTFYRNYILTQEAKAEYRAEYGYDETEFLA